MTKAERAAIDHVRALRPGEHVHGAVTVAEEVERIVVRVFCGHRDRENPAFSRLPPWRECVVVAITRAGTGRTNEPPGVASVILDDAAYRPTLR